MLMEEAQRGADKLIDWQSIAKVRKIRGESCASVHKREKAASQRMQQLTWNLASTFTKKVAGKMLTWQQNN